MAQTSRSCSRSEGPLCGRRRGRSAPVPQPAPHVLGAYRRAVGGKRQADSLQHVLELAHVPRKRVVQHQLQGVGVHALHARDSSLANPGQEVGDEQGEVVPAFPERRHLDDEDRQAKEEVLPHGAGAHGGERSVAGGDDPDVDLPALEAADRAHLAVLEDPEELGLRLERAARRSRPGRACRGGRRRRGPGWSVCAPENAPRRCPKSSLSTRSRGRAAQFSGTRGCCARRLPAWMARATSSLPVPVSPVMRTGVSLREAARARSRTGRMRLDRLTIRSRP